ncbi:hypothetical protein CW751_08915 [Brumimicrobium salinarum]|uniref:DUF4836 domain-containing protein n=1 Tax=Brumimicrobium salinarum TaxID=2058658 RepID=A0A2I0R1N9_9FLAO|nr:hypothetical protein [Brumimicrobium salinarum]PKR80487.1 hypothetical protein CW751_08915 [Brumimicrobium salinarum]
MRDYRKLMFISTLFMLVFLASCKSEVDSDLNKGVTKFVSQTDSIVGYGYIDFKAIKDKSALTEIPDFGALIQEQLSTIEQGLKFEDMIHYALQGPLDRNGVPKNAYVFMSVANKDSLAAMFDDMGFFFEEENDLMTYEEGDFAIGFNDKTMVLAYGGLKGKGAELIADIHQTMIGDGEINDRVESILNTPTDILIASNLEQMYGTSNTSLANLSADKQDEIQSLVKNSHVAFSLGFEEGQLISKFDISNVNEEMKSTFFFQEEADAKINKNLGPGEPSVHMNLSVDLKKMEELMLTFSPKPELSVFQMFGKQGQMMESLVGEHLTDAINGNIGLMVGKEAVPDNINMQNVPKMHMYIGLGNKTENMMDLLETYAEEGTVKDLGDGYYRQDQAMMLVQENAVILHSNDTLKENFKVEGLTKTSNMKEIGNPPFSFYVDLKHFAENDLPVSGGRYDLILGLADHLSLTGNNEEFVLKIVMKNKDVNVLKQITNAFQEDLINQMGNVSF